MWILKGASLGSVIFGIEGFDLVGMVWDVVMFVRRVR